MNKGKSSRKGKADLEDKGGEHKKNFDLDVEGNEAEELDDASSVKSSQDMKGVDFYNNSNKTVIIKNLSLLVNEEDIKAFIESYNNDSFDMQEIRIVRDKSGNSKGFAFVDFSSTNDAAECAKILNNKNFDDHILSCAVSKPPALGENDKRTIFINNLPFDATEESVKSIFEPVFPLYNTLLVRTNIRCENNL